ncbi:hypothetical protein OTK59_22360 [Vibrio natriegens]|uniref:hypothetical protein n=1 Tax=Vibrio natriegens TaxID=691 RepID=UPI002283A08A|nr:hypothetical protein [Vibrio natriegens]MCY9879290.1 hypothetical protein [Vibrio natriegens]
MKQTIYAVMIALALFGCEKAKETVDSVQDTATEAMDKAQETANEMTAVVQDNMNDMQEQAFDFEEFEATSDTARSFSEAVKEVINLDFSDAQSVENVTNRVANNYQCYVEATSESEADSTVSMMMSSLDSDEAKSLIGKAVEQAKAKQECNI